MLLNYIFFSSDKGPVTSLLPSQVNHSPVINHLLLGKKMKPTNRSAKNTIIHIPSHAGGKMSDEDLKAKLNSPWRTHIRVHRKNLARVKGQVGYGDTIGLIAEQNEGGKTSSPIGKEESPSKSEPREGEESESKARTSRKADGQSPEPAYANTNISAVQLKLESLELIQTNKDDAESISSPSCETPISELQNLPTESGTLAKSPQPSNPKSQVFSPFPSVKPLRKSAAARNLGLYGPTERTPTVHFPQMSRSFNKPTSGSSGSKKR